MQNFSSLLKSLPRNCALTALFFVATFSVARSQTLTAPQLLPHTVKVVAGGGTATPASGAACPISGFIATDAYGDGCLATEVLLGTGASTPGPRAAIADAAGNIFFGDYVNGVVHRIDAVTGVLSAVAGGAASSPASGTACGANLSTDAKGDGCVSTLVHLSHPTGLAFSPKVGTAINGDLYIADYGYGEIRKVTATNGVIPATGGVISLVAGSPAGTFGYTVSNATTTINASTQSILDGPYGMAFDSQGDLLVVDEYEAAALAINTNLTATTSVTGVSLAPGTIWKIAGTLTTGPYCTNSTGSSAGCTYNHAYTENTPANSDYLRNSYALAVDPSGNVYIVNTYYYTIQKVTAAGILNTWAGLNGTVGSSQTRGQVGSIAIGSPFGVTADLLGNVYFSDAADGVIWRVDGATQSQYVIANGFGSSPGASGYATTTLPGPGIYNLSVDVNSNLFFGDTEKNTVGEVASGVQFGAVGANQPTQTLDIHFAANDSPAAGAYTLTVNPTNFSLGSAVCTPNSDKTVDCLLPVTATPSALGLFTATLQVNSTLGAIATFNLSGTYVQSPITRTQLTYTAGVICTGTTTYSTSTPIKLTAQVVANGPSAPGGTITFAANGATIGTSQPVTNLGTTAAPIYGATLTTTFATTGLYNLTASYSGDTYFTKSTGTSASSITSATPSYTASAITNMQSTVVAGQTGLYSFIVAQNVYTGTISFSCSNLPTGASCSFSPTTLTASGCSQASVIALSVVTQQGPVTSSFGSGLRGWQGIVTLIAVALALMIGLNRRRVRLAPLWMALLLAVITAGASGCGSGATSAVATPAGTYSVTVSVAGSTGSPATFNVPLTVH